MLGFLYTLDWHRIRLSGQSVCNRFIYDSTTNVYISIVMMVILNDDGVTGRRL